MIYSYNAMIYSYNAEMLPHIAYSWQINVVLNDLETLDFEIVLEVTFSKAKNTSTVEYEPIYSCNIIINTIYYYNDDEIFEQKKFCIVFTIYIYSITPRVITVLSQCNSNIII